MPAGTIVASGVLVSPGGQQGIPGPSVGAVPTGGVVDFAGSAAPSGWLLCDGSAVSRTTYAALFAVLSTTYGTGDGSTTFNLPDLRSRVAVGAGQGTGLTNRALAAAGGEENHQLSIAELAAHTHIQNSHTHTDSGHAHSVTNFVLGATAGGNAYSGSGGTNTGVNYAAITATTATNQNAGSDGAHNNMMPFIALNKIIKT